ncbi:MAG: protein kinase domain-containing protein [Gammaproteobacteria bacterium]
MIISKKYEVLSQLGEGGMGVVYKVRHTALESVSALKVMSTHFGDDPDLVKRFYREARVLARLRHPNIVRVIDIERDEELKFYYFVMEFIEGRTLRDHLRDSGPLGIAQVLVITRQVAAALDFAHHYDPPVIHRDIKPTNIMIEDRSQRVVVMDFGIAKDLGDIDMTRVGTMLGTLRYAPPEQLRHEALDGSADIYALGMVMWEALLGNHPFADLAEYPVYARVTSPEEHDFAFPPGTPASFAALMSKAVRKERSRRYRTMAELLRDIDACAFELGETTPGAVPAPGPGRGPAAGLPGEPAEVAAAAREEKIRGLSEQRQRQHIRRLEEQVAEHKDMAVRQGAAELVPDLFTAACAAEDLAHAQAKGDQFGPACRNLEQALAGFKDASEQAAREGLQRQAGQARAQTAAAKVEADRYGATERAQTVYRNGLMLQAKADALWENQSYREAGDLYGEALSRFEDAQGLAQRSLLEAEAKAAAIKAREACEVAVREGVEEHAAEAFWESVRAERRGDTSIGQGDFAAARDLYLAAVEQYAGACRQAQRERQRQAALAVQAEADAVQRALASLAGAHVEAAYRQGQEAQREGEGHLAAQAFEAAAAAYATARARFQQASASWQRRRAEEARARAVQAGERFPKDFAKALDGLARAVAEEEAGAYVAAAEAYAQAAEHWSRLEEDAQALLAQEQAGAARERLAVARTQGAALRAWAGNAWARADQSAQEAECAWQNQRYGEAVGLYEWALRAYTEAGAAAEATRDEQQAVEARTQAEQSESAARAAGAPQFAQARFVQATAAHQEGTHGLQARHWEDARCHYAEAQRLYLGARAEAERARARAAAEAALEGARAARAALQQAGAPRPFGARIEQAEALFAEAETARSDDRWEDARAGFDNSATRFRQLREEAIVHQAREGAAQARAHALRLQRDIGAAGGWRMALAKGALARGHRLFEAASYAEARASFEKAASRFEARLQVAARRRREPRLALPWAKALPFLALVALAAGVAFYFLRAEREPLPIEPPRSEPPASMVPEATAPPGVSPTPPLPEPLRLRPRPDGGAPIALAEGASQTFAIDVQGTVSRPLRYAWFLDDVPQGTGRQGEGPTWSYAPDFDTAGERLKEIKVVVSDAEAAQAEMRWRVEVVDTNRPPHLRVAMPTTETLTVKSRETVRFSVQGEDPDRDDTLAYVWNVDGARMGEGERFELKSGTPGARQRVEVAVIDRAGLSERRRWEIAVEAPPSLPPLAIRAASPKLAPGQDLVLIEGQSQRFSIEVAGGDPAALEYVWQLDGKKQATTSRWTYKARASASRTKAQELRVVVSGGGGPALEHLWRIRVNPANRPPAIVAFTPTDTRIEVARGTAQRFTVEATDADAGDPLAYSWLLDGRPLAKGSAWEMDAKVPAGQHGVEVKVSDKSGQTATQRWTVAVAEPASPPSITAVTPAAERITAQTDGGLDFSAVASLAADARKGAVSYEWRVDTGPSRGTTTGQFRLPPLPAGTHKLTVVAVSPEGLKSAPRDWTIEVKAKDTKTALAESEVRDWVALYRRAWESKDVDLLLQLGEVTRERASQLRGTLAGYDDFRVEVKDLTIRIDADSARVTFRREDTIDGKNLPHPGLKEVLLEKQANGRLMRRK